jgi:hypothetical protein
LKKYLIKFSVILAVVVLLMVIAASAALNFYFLTSQNTISRGVGKYFNRKIAVGNIFYLPPHNIIIKKVSIPENPFSQDARFLQIQKIWLKLSIPELVLKRRLVVAQICIYGARADCYELGVFIKNKFRQIIDFIRHLPRQDIEFVVREARLDLAKRGNESDYFSADLVLNLKGDSLSGIGSINKGTDTLVVNKGKNKIRRIFGQPLRYGFKGTLGQQEVALDNLELMRENVYSQLWGSSNGSVFKLHGYAFVNTRLEEKRFAEEQPSLFGKIKKSVKKMRTSFAEFLNVIFEEQSGKADRNIVERIKLWLGGVRTSPASVVFSGENLDLLDIDCRLDLALPDIGIEHLSFSVNNMPFSLKGKITLTSPISLDLNVSSDLSHLRYARSACPKRIDLGLGGNLDSRAFKGSGRLNLDFAKKKKTDLPLEKVEIGFADSAFYFDRFPRFKMALGESSLFCQTESNSYRVALQNFRALLHLKDERFKFIRFRSLFYGGSLEGEGRFDIGRLPPAIISRVKIRDVSADRLDGILIYFDKVFGRLYSSMHFKNYPRPDLTGSLLIKEGYLDNFEFFKWVADLFALASLKKLSFGKVTSDFWVSPEGAGLRDVRLYSQGLNLKGDFSLKENDLVNGKFYLNLSKALIKESPKFKPLIRLVGEDFSTLNFDFQLSGKRKLMNFQWLDSDFKKELREAIPGFIQRKIERETEAIIQSISTK